MNRNESKVQPRYSDAATALWIWLTLGVAALLLVPGLRGSDSPVGWLPFWFVIAPLIDLALLRRHWLAATSCELLIRARRRRRPARQQAQRLSRRRTLRAPRIAHESTTNSERPDSRCAS
jgi:hypothetical protein